jgi:hypothetical protein
MFFGIRPLLAIATLVALLTIGLAAIPLKARRLDHLPDAKTNGCRPGVRE